MKICITGGIACGKSLLSHYLNELGVETIDADDIVHELIPEAERRRLAKTVFKDAAARRELESKIHPLVKARILEALNAADSGAQPRSQATSNPARLLVAVIPLLFEVHWDENFDIICCVVSSREKQIERMMTTRGMSREEAESRLAAQLPVGEKAEKSHYVIKNDGSAEELKKEAERFVSWLKSSTCLQVR